MEWEHAETGRKFFGLTPDVLERGEMEHLNILDHTTTQLLTGHGAFGAYLFEHEKRHDSNCESCGMFDHPSHAVLECPTHEDLRAVLEERISASGASRPWCLSSIIRDPLLFEELTRTWRRMFADKDL